MLIGREEERAEIDRLHKKHAVVTLTGAPGVGKSAIAQAVAAARRATSVTLAGTPLEALPGAIARALGGVAGASAPAGVVAAIAGRELARKGKHLLVLDDADDALDLLAKEVLPVLVREAPAAHVLVTARGRLRMTAAARVDVAPLATPGVAEKSVEEVGATSSVRLFVHHASIARTGYRLTKANAPVVAEIVRRLDGHPLAIELCASRLAVLDERALVEALAEDAAAFADGAGASRGRSLRQAFRVSVERLEVDDERMLAACAVFGGPFDLEAAAAAAGEKSDARSRLRVASRLERLEEASLLRIHEQERDDEPRARTFSLDASLRAFVRDRESPDARAVFQARVAEHLASGEGAAVSAFGPVTAPEPAWRENERWSAIAWALDAPKSRVPSRVPPSADPHVPSRVPPSADPHVLAARVLLGNVRAVLARGPLALFVEQATLVLGKAKGLSADLSAELRLACALALIFGGRRDEALPHLQRASELATSKTSARIRALAESKIGLVRGLKGETKAALARFDAAAKAADRSSDPWVRGIVAKDLANVLAEHGRDDDAVVQLGRARELFRAARDVREEAFVLMMLGSRLVDAGRMVDAQRDCKAALALFEQIGDRRSQGWTCVLLGIAALEDGKPEIARRHVDRALDHVRAVGDVHTEGLALSYLGNIALEQRMLSDAEEAYAEARVLLDRAGDTAAAAMCLAGAAVVDVLSGRTSAAKDRFARAKKLVAADPRVVRREAIALLATTAEARPKPVHLTASTEEIRFAQRIVALASAFARPAAPGSSRRVVASAESIEALPRDASEEEGPLEWLVAADGRSLQGPDGEVVRVDPKGPSAKIVVRLAQERLRYPGRAVPLGAIVGAAWPGEAMLAAAAKNRVHVTLARLRRAGLGALLVRDDDGYLFDPKIPLRIAAKGAAG
ncbi:MAG: hypothetical protein JST00_40225 [Deltaproteobacteria bacterium]|nr:hypothetical protein [Deltaproteobacteria bacterium]